MKDKTQFYCTECGNETPFTFTYEDGTEITYGVGKTYVCIIANSGSFSVE